MRRLIALLVPALVAILAVTTVPATPARADLPGTSNDGVRIMPLGDSITHGGFGGYRIKLWQNLTAAGVNVDFVGTLASGTSALGDHDHEGHVGWRIDELDAHIGHWLFATDPRTVLLQIGTNDINQGYQVSTMPNRLAQLIDHILAYKPDVQLFVAQITPLATGGDHLVQAYNAAIPGILATRGPRVHLVDMYHAIDPATDLLDGVHPNASGNDKMADVWTQALTAVPAALQPLPAAYPRPIGSTVSFEASNGDYVSAWQPHSHMLEAISPHVAAWEKFVVVDAGHGWIGLWSVGSGAYVQATATPTGALMATAPTLTSAARFRWIEVAPGKTVLVAAANSNFVGWLSATGVDPLISTALLATSTEVLEWQVAP
jgi:lysophospholipase L1-like esterase